MTAVKDLLLKEGVELDETGYAGATSRGLFVNLQCDKAGESLYLYCSVAKLPDPVPQKLVREILHSGLLGLGTDGGHLGLHQPTRLLVYSLRLDVASLNETVFRNALETFTAHALGYIEKWNNTDTPIELPLPGMFSGGVVWG